MLFYSDETNTLYETVEELEAAERDHKVALEMQEKHLKEKEAEEAAAKSKLSAGKKQYATQIEACDKKLAEAREKYQEAKTEAEAIIKECSRKAGDILRKAEEAVIEAEKERYKALNAFNKKFGPYTVRYTDDKAYNEFKKSLDSFGELFGKDSILRSFLNLL